MTPSLDPAQLDRAVAIIAEHIAQGRQPGATLAVARHGEVRLHHVAGEARLGQAATDETLWLLYSNTKVITACAVWMLVEEGRMNFSDPVARHLPGFERHGKGGVTLVHLLSHQAGFRNGAVPDAAFEDAATLREAVCDFRPESAPGAVVHYHPGAAHWVAAALIRAVTGEDHRNFIRSRIIEKLGLGGDLFVGLPAAQQHRAADIHDAGPTPRMPECTAAYRAAGIPGGGGYATAPAMALFYQALLGHGPRLVSPRMMAYVTRNFTADRPDLAQGVPMHRGLGPHSRGTTDQIRGLGSLAHPTTFGHGGVGSSYCWGDPASGTSMAFIANLRQADEAWHSDRMETLSNLVHAAITR